MCRALTEALDSALVELHAPWSETTALVALGGYGRSELSPHSDVDLMLLHDQDDVSTVAAAVFRPLWDAKLKVGHAVRTVKEAGAAARGAFETQTTLLTGRLISGRADLFVDMSTRIASVTKARPLRRYLVSAEIERRQASPYLLMATDLKEGRGGLRVLQSFEWERRREDLIGRFSGESTIEEEVSRDFLLRLRNALHVVSGRRYDVFSPEIREAAAKWLGEDVRRVGDDLVTAMREVDRLASHRWPELVESPGGRSRPWRRKSVGEPSLRQRFTELIEAGTAGRLEAEKPGGWFDEALPEYRHVVGLAQIEPFHLHPVADHLWRTVDEMVELSREDGPYGEIARDLSRPGLLSIAAFLHDIGKGTGRDHSEAGAEIAEAFAERLDFGPDERSLLVGAVRHHLLLPSTATRRDLDDPAVIADVAESVGSVQQLQVLYLLTIADSKATGPSMWSEWKATLLRSLYMRVAAALDGEDVAVPTATLEEIEALAADKGISDVRTHLDMMPKGYLRSARSEDVVWHLELIAARERTTTLGVRDSDPIQTVVVVAPASSRLRHLVAAVFASNGIDVLEARMFTRDDGVAIDTFSVRDDMTGGRVDTAKWDTVADGVERAVGGDVDPVADTAKRASAYGRSTSGSDSRVTAVRDEATGRLRVVVKATDRIGRLAEVLGVLSDCGIEIGLAKLDVREGGIVDTFHITTPGEEADITDLERRIAAGLSS